MASEVRVAIVERARDLRGSVRYVRSYLVHALVYYCFFFQAEDGIRDYKVTGVQTCALPIYGPGGTSTVINHNRMLGDFFLVLESEGTGPMGPVKEVAVIGYDSNRKTYTFDQFSTRGEHGTATATVSGDMWTWLIPEVDMGGKKVTGRFTIKEVSPTEYTYKYDTSVDGGAWTNGLEGQATKTK